MTRLYSEREVDAILRRAETDPDLDEGGHWLTIDDVVAIGAEVGIPSAAIRSVAEGIQGAGASNRVSHLAAGVGLIGVVTIAGAVDLMVAGHAWGGLLLPVAGLGLWVCDRWAWRRIEAAQRSKTAKLFEYVTQLVTIGLNQEQSKPVPTTSGGSGEPAPSPPRR